MACRLLGAKPLSEPMLEYCQLDPCNKLHRNLNRNSNIFIEEDALEIVVWKRRPFCLGLNVLNALYITNIHMGNFVWMKLWITFKNFVCKVTYMTINWQSVNCVFNKKNPWEARRIWTHLFDWFIVERNLMRSSRMNTIALNICPRQFTNITSAERRRLCFQCCTFVCLFVCLFVRLLATLRKNDWRVFMKFSG